MRNDGIENRYHKKSQIICKRNVPNQKFSKNEPSLQPIYIDAVHYSSFRQESATYEERAK